MPAIVRTKVRLTETSGCPCGANGSTDYEAGLFAKRPVAGQQESQFEVVEQGLLADRATLLAYRKGVPNPARLLHRPDEPRLSPNLGILAEYVAFSGDREFRVFSLFGKKEDAGIAFEVDTDSPPTLQYLPVIPNHLVEYCESVFIRAVRIDGLGRFVIVSP
jgi:hypothetical protein